MTVAPWSQKRSGLLSGWSHGGEGVLLSHQRGPAEGWTCLKGSFTWKSERGKEIVGRFERGRLYQRDRKNTGWSVSRQGSEKRDGLSREGGPSSGWSEKRDGLSRERGLSSGWSYRTGVPVSRVHVHGNVKGAGFTNVAGKEGSLS